MQSGDSWVVVGLDNGGTANNATVLDASGKFLVDELVETPSRVTEGPDVAVEALVEAIEDILRRDGPRPGPGPRGRAGHAGPGQRRRRHLVARARPTSPTRAGGASTSAARSRRGSACRWSTTTTATRPRSTPTTRYFGRRRSDRSSVSAIVGTGLGGGVIETGQVVKGAAGMAGELGHVHIPMDGLLGPDQPMPRCNCGFVGDVESVASLTGIERNLLPYWLTRFPGPRARRRRVAGEGGQAGARVRRAAATRWRSGSSSSRRWRSGRLFTIAANFTDPRRLLRRRRRGRGGTGVPRLVPGARCASTRRCARSRPRPPRFALVPDLDMAGARGAAIAALEKIHAR